MYCTANIYGVFFVLGISDFKLKRLVKRDNHSDGRAKNPCRWHKGNNNTAGRLTT